MRRITAALVFVFSIGCGPDPADVQWVRDARIAPAADVGFDAEPDDVASMPDDGLEPWDLSGAGPLTGVFALEVILRGEAVIELESRQLLRLRVLQRGRHVRQQATLCDLAFPSLEGIADLSIPPPLARLLRSRVIESEGEFLGDADPVGASYVPVVDPLVVGAALDDPYTDEMPTEVTDDRVVDEDGDGSPGVSIGVDVVVCDQPEQMYVALRLFNELSGTVESVDEISGGVTPQLDQVVLGLSHECVQPAASIEIELVPGSTFRAVRVDDEDVDGDGIVSCGELTDAAPRLFGEFWARGDD